MAIKNNFNQGIEVEETEAANAGTNSTELEITGSEMEDGFSSFEEDSEGSVFITSEDEATTSDTLIQSQYSDYMNGMINMSRVDVILTSLLLGVLLISTFCKLILSIKNIKDTNIQIYQVFAFGVIYLLNGMCAAIALGDVSIDLMKVNAILLLMPIVLTIFSIYKNKKLKSNKTKRPV